MKSYVIVSLLIIQAFLPSAHCDEVCLQPTALVIEWLRKEPEAYNKIRNHLCEGRSIIAVPVHDSVSSGLQEAKGLFVIARGLSGEDEVIVSTDMAITEFHYPNATSIEEIEKQITAMPREEFEQNDGWTKCRNIMHAHYDQKDNRVAIEAVSRCITSMPLASLLQRMTEQDKQSE